METLSAARATFWSERFWLSNNVTWDDFRNQHLSPSQRLFRDVSAPPGLFRDVSAPPGLFRDVSAPPGLSPDAPSPPALFPDGASPPASYPELPELLWSVPLALLLLVLRAGFERLVMRPLARACGLRSARQRKPENNKLLESSFRTSRRPSDREIRHLAASTGWTETKTHTWFRLRRNQDKASPDKKFCESGWRLLVYGLALLGGLYVLQDEAFFHDWSLSWDMSSWPRGHHVKPGFFLYYILELAFYLSLMVSLCSDVRRSDFLEMAVHHVATIVLLLTSWTINFVRLGMLLMIIHDPADSWLEAAKLARYAGRTGLGNALFVVFILVWIVTRTVAYPFLIVIPGWRAYYIWAGQLGQHVPLFFLNLCFMSLLVVLNLLWTVLIVRTAVRAVTVDLKDARSGSDTEHEPEHGDEANGNVKHKTH